MNLRDATKIINKADTGITLNRSEQKLAELMLHAPVENAQAAKSMQQFMQTSEFPKALFGWSLFYFKIIF